MSTRSKFLALLAVALLLAMSLGGTFAFASSDVAIFAIFVSPGGGSSSINMGHAFLMVQNISSSTFTIGNLSVPAGVTITFGTWGNKDEHKGVWYNLENYLVNVRGDYTDRASLEMRVTAAQVTAISNYVLNNDSWSLFSNCSTFACNLWNSLSSRQLSCGVINTPANLYKSITGYNHQIARSIDFDDYIGYYDNGFVHCNPYGPNYSQTTTSFSAEEILYLAQQEVFQDE